MRNHFFLGPSAVILAICAISLPALAQDSVTYQINPAHTGAIFLPWGFRPPVHQLWGRTFGGVVSYPLIAGGRIFVDIVSRGANASNQMVALDEMTGATIWSRFVPGSSFAPLTAYDSSRVFEVNGAGLLSAYSAADGTLLWQKRLPNQSYFTAPPVARDDVVYVSGAGGGGTLYAVRATDGAILWTRSLPTGDLSSPTLSSDGILLSYPPCEAEALDQVSGALRWFYGGSCSGGGGFTGAYYAGAFTTQTTASLNGTVANVFSERDGSALPAAPVGAFAPAFQSGVGYYVGNSTITALSVPTNKVLWSHAANIQYPLIVVNNTVFGLTVTPSGVGSLVLFDGMSGTQIQTIPVLQPTELVDTGGEFAGLAAGGVVVAVPNGNTLTVFGQATP